VRIAKPHKRYPVIVDLTRVLGLGKAENERLQHTDVTGRTINNQQFKNSMNIRIKVFLCEF
jgi:hypothetical protein